MGSRELIAALGLPAAAAAVVAEYLSTLDTALPLPRRERTRILIETADALAGEIEAAVAAGHSPTAAAQQAVAGFGTPELLAGQFAAAIAPGMSRRTGLGLITSGPLIGATWVAAAGKGADLPARIASMLRTTPVLPALLVVSVACAALAVAAGRQHGRTGIAQALAPRAARLAALGCMAADAVLLAVASGQLLAADMPVAVGCAALLSAGRMTAAATAWLRLWRLRMAAY